jgi:tRNA1(Val) A37 N6-methylase TrmN6
MRDAQSDDRFLGGRVIVRQGASGFRSGLDAVMLAAAVPAGGGDDVLELGSGAGATSLCLAERLPDCTIRGVECEGELAALADENARANGYHDRVRFVRGDVFDMPRELRRDFSHVFANPPFHGDEGQKPPEAQRAAALHDEGRLADWLEVGLKRTASGGTFTVILRADRLGEVLRVLPERGALVFPLWPRADADARRVIVQLEKGSRRPFALLRGLVLHHPDGTYTDEAEAVLRDGKALSFACGK